MALSNAQERFMRAVGILADEKGRIKERLLIAYASQLSRVNAKQDLPFDLQNKFYELRNVVSDAEMPYGYGERAATKIDALSEEEASGLAATIFELFLKLCNQPSEPVAT